MVVVGAVAVVVVVAVKRGGLNNEFGTQLCRFPRILPPAAKNGHQCVPRRAQTIVRLMGDTIVVVSPAGVLYYGSTEITVPYPIFLNRAQSA